MLSDSFPSGSAALAAKFPCPPDKGLIDQPSGTLIVPGNGRKLIGLSARATSEDANSVKTNQESDTRLDNGAGRRLIGQVFIDDLHGQAHILALPDFVNQPDNDSKHPNTDEASAPELPDLKIR